MKETVEMESPVNFVVENSGVHIFANSRMQFEQMFGFNIVETYKYTDIDQISKQELMTRKMALVLK